MFSVISGAKYHVTNLILLIALSIILLLVSGGSSFADDERVVLGSRTFTIPDRPVSGTLFGSPFHYERAVFDNQSGSFEIWQGERKSTKLVFKTFLRSNIEELGRDPAFIEGVTISTHPEKSSPVQHGPYAHLDYISGDKAETLFVSKDFYLYISFEEEIEPRKVSGKILYASVREPEDLISGTFVTFIKGYRESSGKPDISSDSRRLFHYLALEHMKKKFKGRQFSITEERDFQICYKPSEADFHDISVRKIGYYDVKYSAEGSEPTNLKFQFLKKDNKWSIYRTLTPGQLFSAHPYRELAPSSCRIHPTVVLAAKEVEKEISSRDLKVYNERIEFWKNYMVIIYRIEPSGQSETHFFKTDYTKGVPSVQKISESEVEDEFLDYLQDLL